MSDSNTSRREFFHSLLESALAVSLAEEVMAQTSSSSDGIPTRVLGRTKERVSIVCLGGWHIGAVKEKSEAIGIMHAAIDEGINFFDNAWDYHNGRSEDWMGEALSSSGRRNKVLLMTKNCERDYEGSKRISRRVCGASGQTGSICGSFMRWSTIAIPTGLSKKGV